MTESVDAALNLFDLKGDFIELNRDDLKNTLNEVLNANFNISERSHNSLKKVTNTGSLRGVLAVVGNEFYDKYEDFCDKWVTKYESEDGHRELPKMINVDPDSDRKPSGSKTVGMRHYLHYMISFATGDMEHDQVKKYMEAMDGNGYLWQERSFDKDRTELEFNGKTIKIGSIPPGFAKDAWQFISSWKK